MIEKNVIPEGATHLDAGPSNNQYLRISEYIHDYWSFHEKRWITFEGGHNIIRDHWIPINATKVE